MVIGYVKFNFEDIWKVEQQGSLLTVYLQDGKTKLIGYSTWREANKDLKLWKRTKRNMEALKDTK